jgi:hypothetical protein
MRARRRGGAAADESRARRARGAGSRVLTDA